MTIRNTEWSRTCHTRDNYPAGRPRVQGNSDPGMPGVPDVRSDTNRSLYI